MLNLDEGKKAVVFARAVVEEFVKTGKTPKTELKGVFAENFENLVLGGMGFNDILFILGFANLVSSGLCALIQNKFHE